MNWWDADLFFWHLGETILPPSFQQHSQFSRVLFIWWISGQMTAFWGLLMFSCVFSGLIYLSSEFILGLRETTNQCLIELRLFIFNAFHDLIDRRMKNVPPTLRLSNNLLQKPELCWKKISLGESRWGWVLCLFVCLHVWVWPFLNLCQVNIQSLKSAV